MKILPLTGIQDKICKPLAKEQEIKDGRSINPEDKKDEKDI